MYLKHGFHFEKKDFDPSIKPEIYSGIDGEMLLNLFEENHGNLKVFYNRVRRFLNTPEDLSLKCSRIIFELERQKILLDNLENTSDSTLYGVVKELSEDTDLPIAELEKIGRLAKKFHLMHMEKMYSLSSRHKRALDELLGSEITESLKLIIFEANFLHKVTFEALEKRDLPFLDRIRLLLNKLELCIIDLEQMTQLLIVREGHKNKKADDLSGLPKKRARIRAV